MSTRRNRKGEPLTEEEDAKRIELAEYDLEHGGEDDWEAGQTAYEKDLERHWP